jgi:alpha-1,6-mannosyltransferase
MLLGLAGTVLLTIGGVGAGGALVHDPLLDGTPLSLVHYGHGKDLASAVLYGGMALLVWAWVRLGRDVRAERLNTRHVVVAVGIWTLPFLVAPPLLSRDVYSYLAQGALALNGLDPYQTGPSALPGTITDNVSWVWQNTPAPYGPLFVLLVKCIVAITGDWLIAGIIVVRLVMILALGLLCWSLTGLTRHLGGRNAVALWLTAANPLVLVHLVGGPHNDMLMVSLLCTGVLLVLDRRHVYGIAVVTLGAAVKVTAVVALPFLIWVWASRMRGSARTRFAKATAAIVAVSAATCALCTVVSGVGLGWIPALSSSSFVVNWLSLPTGAGQLVHTLVNLVVTVGEGGFLMAGRALGIGLLAYVAARQWWAARSGDAVTAIRRCAVVLFAVAALLPVTLPWYFTWSLAVAAGLAWSASGLVLVVGASVWLLLITFPNGGTALYSWGYVAGACAAAVLAAVSLLRPDPLGLSSREPRPHLNPTADASAGT